MSNNDNKMKNELNQKSESHFLNQPSDLALFSIIKETEKRKPSLNSSKPPLPSLGSPNFYEENKERSNDTTFRKNQ